MITTTTASSTLFSSTYLLLHTQLTLEMPFKVGIIVISDACFKDPSQDETTAALVALLEECNKANGEPIYTIEKTKIIPESVFDIQRKVTMWTQKEDLRLILTCGGIGFTIKDETPEAVGPLLKKEAPGIVHAMLSEAFKVTPFAMLSRPVAGVRHKTLIVTLPGSPRASRENLQAILTPLPHALIQIENEDARAVHEKMNRTLNNALPGTSNEKK